jgi:hypothetical protein
MISDKRSIKASRITELWCSELSECDQTRTQSEMYDMNNFSLRALGMFAVMCKLKKHSCTYSLSPNIRTKCEVSILCSRKTVFAS